jgi:hypothetical protein
LLRRLKAYITNGASGITVANVTITILIIFLLLLDY